MERANGGRARGGRDCGSSGAYEGRQNEGQTAGSQKGRGEKGGGERRWKHGRSNGMGQRKWLRELFEGVALKDGVCGSQDVAREETNTRENVDKNRERELGPNSSLKAECPTLCKTIECTKLGDRRLNNASG